MQRKIGYTGAGGHCVSLEQNSGSADCSVAAGGIGHKERQLNSAGEDLPYRQVFESILDGIVLTDLSSGLVVAANPAAAALLGYGRAELVGRRHVDLLHPASRPRYADWVAAARAGGAVAATVSHARRDGTPLAVEVRGGPGVWGGAACLLVVLREPGESAAVLHQTAAHAALEERKRLAKNLHDAVNQSLFSAGIIAEVLPRLWHNHPEEVLGSLEDLRRLTRGALAEMRGLLVDLHPQEPTDSDLGDLLPLLADSFSVRTNVPVTMTLAAIGPLPDEAQVALYRTCREALNNIVRHAAATQVSIALREDGGMVELSICDDGRGFDPEHIPPDHFGLAMMRERATAVGASLTIISRPGEGTAIIIRRPAGVAGTAG